MNSIKTYTYFPSQRVSREEKNKPEWYANCIDFIIDAGVACSDKQKIDNYINILHGNIPDEFYKKTLNPYNSANEKYTRFPATMRNLDIMSDIVRRYVSEYIKGIHEFIVGANNPEIIVNKDAKLKEHISLLAQEAFTKMFQQKYQELINQGVPQEQINPQEIVPNIDEFIKDFNENYIDEQSEQGQQLLNYIKDNTDDDLLYSKAYLDYVAFGECYSYTEIKGNKIIKECVPITEAYPIPNNSFFAEDYDMFARCMKLTYQQIIDMFKYDLSDKDIKFLETFYAKQGINGKVTKLTYDGYFEHYPDVCGKFNKEERELFKREPINVSDVNGDLYDVWHVVWRSEVKKGILTYINPAGIISTTVVDEDFVFNKELGHIKIEWVYESQVYEGYRIGARRSAIYPIKFRAIPYNRNGKLPYNGISEILPLFGKFSIVKIITPFQILRNIISYHREMVIAKNKLLILIMPESLLGNEEEDKIYKMAADGVLYYDDSNDSNSLKAQQIRLLNANLNNYISELTNLMEAIKQEARELVDMTPQRYGQITQSAGKGVTDEAIARGSMGSVVITFAFDEFRKKDYNRDLDYAKLAYIDGLNAMYFDNEKRQRYISLDVNSFVNSDLSVTVRNNIKELDKFNELKNWAFSAAQNGDLDMALAAITGDNVSAMKKTITRFMELKRQHETELKQADQAIEQAKLQAKLQEIAAKGEEDRKTEQLKYYYELQAKYVDVDLSILNNDNSATTDKAAAQQSIERNKLETERLKFQLENKKLNADMYNKAADRNVKREQIAAQVKIAKTNKNKYDK